MRLLHLELNGFKSFPKKTSLEFESPLTSIVGPNGSGKSNVVEAFRFVLGEQSMKSMRGKAGADMIFKGSKNLPKSSRGAVTIYFNNKDKVFKLSNDSGENVDLDYETVSIGREVYPDGLNKYILNGSEVRLKDINNLLSSVNIGSSGHHIISQGEADRILSSSPRDLREMIEDALGLKIYQYKIRESERKLEKSENNMKEVVMLRRENAPHLNFLRKQMEKFEKAREMKVELATLYEIYLRNESFYLEESKNILNKEKASIQKELEHVSLKIKEHEGTKERENKNIHELKVIEEKIASIRLEKNELERKLGRIEGMLLAKEKKVKLAGRCPLCGNEVKEMHPEQVEKRQLEEKELLELENSEKEMKLTREKLEKEEEKESAKVEELKQKINEEMESLRDQEREKFTWKVKHQELASALGLLRVKEESLSREQANFEEEIKEGGGFLGSLVLAYRNSKAEAAVSRHEQEEEKKKIERIKIKLEDVGAGGGEEVSKEFESATERDQFLAKEMNDLEASIQALQNLMLDLKAKIDIEFKDGVKKINKEFQEFFSLMFDGGTGALSIVTPEKKKKRNIDEDEVSEEEEGDVEKPEEGIEISISLPHKKVRELHALSGGERSLTSIALLFAMSQVNPPPFLILDETDAALDEANSRKFGDMIEKLSKHSQLIVITHNRESMSRADVLYGVTIGQDGASKLLSVKFDEAAAIAK